MNSYLNYNILFIILICIIILYLVKEPFQVLGYPTRLVNPTRNMSYDLRCEPTIPKVNYAFMGSSIGPHTQYRCLNI